MRICKKESSATHDLINQQPTQDRNYSVSPSHPKFKLGSATLIWNRYSITDTGAVL